jgi:hypothetical protein
MIPLPPGRAGLHHLGVEQQRRDRDDQVAGGHRKVTIEHRRQGRRRHQRNGEDRIGERDVEQKDDDVEERKREQQQGKRDQVHGGGFLRAWRCRHKV